MNDSTIAADMFIKKDIYDLRVEINKQLEDATKMGEVYIINRYIDTDDLPALNYEHIRQNNIEYFRKHLTNSTVDIIDNSDAQSITKQNDRKIYNQKQYPITKTNYSIPSYYRIRRGAHLPFTESISEMIRNSIYNKRLIIRV